jgi:hypothetical protein
MVIDRDDDGVPAHCDIEYRDSVDFKDEDPLQRSLSFILLLLASAYLPYHVHYRLHQKRSFCGPHRHLPQAVVPADSSHISGPVHV